MKKNEADSSSSPFNSPQRNPQHEYLPFSYHTPDDEILEVLKYAQLFELDQWKATLKSRIEQEKINFESAYRRSWFKKIIDICGGVTVPTFYQTEFGRRTVELKYLLKLVEDEIQLRGLC